MARSEAPNPLIFATKVNGTPVLDTEGERIGHIEDVAIGKLSGEVAFAVLSFGGFLGIGEKFHPLPWSALTYDTRLNGYVVTLSEQQLRDAPTYSKEELADLEVADAPWLSVLADYYDGLGPSPRLM